MLCIYHIADHDGKGSAGIVHNVYPDAEFLGLNHDMAIPYDEIRKHDKIIVCDFALPLDFMFELSKSKDFTWIDHHISVINEYNEIIKREQYPEIKGLRRSGTAALILTWEYFYSNKEIPLGLKLLGLNDIFDLRDERVRPFEYAIQSLGINRPTDEIWQKLINNEINIEETIEKGRAILSWIQIRNYRLFRSMSFESKISGYKCICANMAQGYSEFFDSLENLSDYDVMVNFYKNSKNAWNLTFYTAKPDIDVSKIAASFGGGGHRAAAGASNLQTLPDFLKYGTYRQGNI
ncbi:MAG: hypothetical protein IJX20_02585 [Alphaproteobacteria bacterium]|nr:hypothetical protein [Alphaproteobacteria bacterium]